MNISPRKMDKAADFTIRKFLSFSPEKQHKKCAELVRVVYEKLLHHRDVEEDLAVYEQMLGWMKEPVLGRVTVKELANRYHHHNSLAGVSKKEHHLLPQVRKGDRSEAEQAWPIAIYLDHIRSAHNVGSILRTVEAFALGAVYFSADTPFIGHKQVQDTAMGAEKWVVCHQDKDLSELPAPIIALETSDDAVSLYDFIFPESFTLVVGNEEYGCSEEILQKADHLVEIPLRGRKNSLNVANAFAIVANEIARTKVT